MSKEHPISLHSSGTRSRSKASRFTVGFRHAMDWRDNTTGLTNYLSGNLMGLTGGSMIGGGVDSARGGVVSQLKGGESAGKIPGGKLGNLPSARDNLIEYLIATQGIHGSINAVNPALPTRRWIYGSLKKGALKKHSAGDATQNHVEELLRNYVRTPVMGKSGGLEQGGANASKPIDAISGAFFTHLQNYIDEEINNDLRREFESSFAESSEAMEVISEAAGEGLSEIGGASYQEVAVDVGKKMGQNQARVVENMGHKTGGANPMDLENVVLNMGTVEGINFKGMSINDIAEGNWFSDSEHHGKGSEAVRNAWMKEHGNDALTTTAGIKKFYNKQRIPTYNSLMKIITKFAEDTAGSGDSPAARELRRASGETREAWYRRQAVFYGTQINKVVGESKAAAQKKGSKTGKYLLSGAGKGQGPAGYIKGMPRPRVDSDTVGNPYAQTERGNASSLHTIINAALAEGLYASEADGLEKASLEDVKFVLHHMGNVGAEYGQEYMKDELIKEGFELTEYGEIMSYNDGAHDYTLAINFRMYKGGEKKGQFKPLGKGDVGIITRSQFDIYTEVWANIPQAARAEALELAVISKTMGSMNEFFVMNTGRARTIQDAYRFTCRADAAIPAILDELMENFLLLVDNAAEKHISELKKDINKIGTKFTKDVLRPQVFGKVKDKWPTHAWGAHHNIGSGLGGSADRIHSNEYNPPAYYVGKNPAYIQERWGSYLQEGDTYFETRDEYATRTGAKFGWPGDWLNMERKGAYDPRTKDYKVMALGGAIERAEGKGVMARSLGKGAGILQLRQTMTARRGETNWIDAMTEGRNIYGTFTSQEEAEEIGTEKGRGGWFGEDEFGPRVRERMSELKQEDLISSGKLGTWVPNLPPSQAARQYVSSADSDLGFIWALPYATWNYARLGGSIGSS